MSTRLSGYAKAVIDGWSSTTTLTLLVVGEILLAVFVVVVARSASPLLPLRVVLEWSRSGSYLATLLSIVGLFAIPGHGPAQHRRRYRYG